MLLARLIFFVNNVGVKECSSLQIIEYRAIHNLKRRVLSKLANAQLQSHLDFGSPSSRTWTGNPSRSQLRRRRGFTH